jgi:hypothetical protein
LDELENPEDLVTGRNIERIISPSSALSKPMAVTMAILVTSFASLQPVSKCIIMIIAVKIFFLLINLLLPCNA